MTLQMLKQDTLKPELTAFYPFCACESNENVTGPSFSSATVIIAPNTPSFTLSGSYAFPTRSTNVV